MSIRALYHSCALGAFFLLAACAHTGKPAGGALLERSGPRPAWIEAAQGEGNGYFVGRSNYVRVRSSIWNGPEDEAVRQATAQAVDGIVHWLGVEVDSRYTEDSDSTGRQDIRVELKLGGQHTLQLDRRRFETYWELYEENGARFQTVWVRVPFSRADYERTTGAIVDAEASEARADLTHASAALKRGDVGSAFVAYAKAVERSTVLEKYGMLPAERLAGLRQSVEDARRRLAGLVSSLQVRREGDRFVLAAGVESDSPPQFVVGFRDAGGRLLTAAGVPFEVRAEEPRLRVVAQARTDSRGRGIVQLEDDGGYEGEAGFVITIAGEAASAAGIAAPTLRLTANVVPGERVLPVVVLVDDSAVEGGLPAELKADIESRLAATVQQAGYVRIERGSRKGLRGNEGNAELRRRGFGIAVRSVIESSVDTALTPNLHTFEGEFGMQVVSLVDGRELSRLGSDDPQCSSALSGAGGNRTLAIRQAVAMSGCDAAFHSVLNPLQGGRRR